MPMPPSASPPTPHSGEDPCATIRHPQPDEDVEPAGALLLPLGLAVEAAVLALLEALLAPLLEPAVVEAPVVAPLLLVVPLVAPLLLELVEEPPS